MEHEEIKQIVRETLTEILELEEDEVGDEAHIADDLGGDSIRKLELIVALEKRFDIHYAPEEAAGMDSVESIIQATRNHVRSRT
ncbi:MAG TPA: acyl carrier protein [Pyrinomonadaceae bacterium]|nr:acyl carrier protein [Pyrinomonadaceae bacterium]